MPNHITNVLEFDCPEERMREIGEFLRGDKSNPFGTIDFNVLIPMPESLNVESSSRGADGYRAYSEFANEAENMGVNEVAILEAQYKERFKEDPEIWALGKCYYENRQNYGATTWYDWRWEHWGTKWNAYDCVTVSPDEKTLIFNTAWNSVPPIVETISAKFPEVSIRYGWADEDIGYNVGKVLIRGGAVREQNIPVGGSKEAYEMAAEIMGDDLADWGLVLSKDGSTYEYHEPEPLTFAGDKATKSHGDER